MVRETFRCGFLCRSSCLGLDGKRTASWELVVLGRPGQGAGLVGDGGGAGEEASAGTGEQGAVSSHEGVHGAAAG